MSYSSCSLSTIAREARGSGEFDIDDKKCRIGRAAAEEILKEIDTCNQQKTRSAKKEVLRLQSDLETRKQIAYYEKELCRQKRLKENTTIQKYAYEMKEKKWELQRQQLQVPVSENFKHFMECLLTLDEMDKKYFLQSLKMGLNERSVKLLQPLYQEYEKCRLQDESKERENQLEELDKILTHSSLGIEHFFREMAVLYENIAALKQKVGHDLDIDSILDILVDTMTEEILSGTAIEIVDSDAVNVPVEWLKAVFNRVEDASNSTFFRVLGALSSGKSTLLNTTFGLNFPVSSGRCTRGAYMQLVKGDESLKETLNCDYVGVIDSEGLMTIAGINGTYYDNELSTFITGLSDLTLVVIKGEGNEMQNVLPLAIHVFLRMNVVGEHQACHFVHQNMGAVDAMTKTATEIDAFVRDLNAKTLVAAKDTDQDDRYQKFADVLQYDATKNNTYAPGLWDGALPMGKTNSLYATTIQQLKSDIISNAEDMQRGPKQKTVATFEDFTVRLDELWDGIKYENFVLSFKNVLAVEAHRKVIKMYDEAQWKIKREIRENIQQTEHSVENEIIGGNLQKTISQVVDANREKLATILMVKIGELEKMVMHYFQCLGCNECDTDIRNRHLLADNEKEFEDEIRTLKRALNREIDGSMDNLEVKMKTDQIVHGMSREMDQILQKKVKEAIFERKTENISNEEAEAIFDSLWQDATEVIRRRIQLTEDDVNIEAVVQATLRKLLGTDDHLYLRSVNESRRRSLKTRRVMRVDGNRHLKMKIMVGSLILHVNEEDVDRIQRETLRIIEETRQHYNPRTTTGGKRFNQKYVELLFKDVLEHVENLDDRRVKTTKEYKADLCEYIANLAVVGFTEMHQAYRVSSSPQTLLDIKKKSYFDVFMIKMGFGNTAAQFCENVLKDIIVNNVEEMLSPTELLHDLRVYRGENFRDVKSIQAAIMLDLLELTRLGTKEKTLAEQFKNYKQYTEEYEESMKRKMNSECVDNFVEKNRYKLLAQVKLDDTINKVLEAIDETVDSLCDDAEIIGQFFKAIQKMKISYDDKAAYHELSVAERKEFQNIVHQQLQGTVRENIMDAIKSWDVKEKIDNMNLVDFLFTEMVGCCARCPFCQVPCDAHSGGKTQGNHSATQHRPSGIQGCWWNSTDRLTIMSCCAKIASDIEFRNDRVGGEWVPYADYYKHYPNWTIRGDADPDVEKYWKWVFAEYNEKIAKLYHDRGQPKYWKVKEPNREYRILPANDVPKQWGEHTREEIILDMEKNYHVKIVTYGNQINMFD